MENWCGPFKLRVIIRNIPYCVARSLYAARYDSVRQNDKHGFVTKYYKKRIKSFLYLINKEKKYRKFLPKFR